MSKGTYCGWDVLEQAGLADRSTQLRSIALLNNNSSGEVRIYDMYVRVPDNGTDGIAAATLPAAAKSVKRMQAGRIVIEKNGKRYNTMGLEMK